MPQRVPVPRGSRSGPKRAGGPGRPEGEGNLCKCQACISGDEPRVIGYPHQLTRPGEKKKNTEPREQTQTLPPGRMKAEEESIDDLASRFYTLMTMFR